MLQKIFAIAVSGAFIGFAGAAALADGGAHDMADTTMTAPSPAQGAPTQIAATTPNAITIDNFAFGPAAITVAAGTKVTWTNRDDEPHTVVSADEPRLFKSGPLDTEDSFSFTFDKPGTYRYFCSIHPHMTGTVVVQ